ncbi:hypothetical protein KC19_10G050800 [Ceratodon purpureus]|uniref:Uncharacterized protein n=1 Tax=Ceratodon purpureus TaxID=3225 RepID=A0A8T0GH21_CERPU|nr:hypothetical protein KC19_10G050800 [Ceratodon purpureus]
MLFHSYPSSFAVNGIVVLETIPETRFTRSAGNDSGNLVTIQIRENSDRDLSPAQQTAGQPSGDELLRNFRRHTWVLGYEATWRRGVISFMGHKLSDFDPSHEIAYDNY